MKRMWINAGALAVILAGGAVLAVADTARAEARATCTINGVTVEGDICTSDGKTCKCA